MFNFQFMLLKNIVSVFIKLSEVVLVFGIIKFLAFNKPEIKPYHNNYDF